MSVIERNLSHVFTGTAGGETSRSDTHELKKIRRQLLRYVKRSGFRVVFCDPEKGHSKRECVDVLFGQTE